MYQIAQYTPSIGTRVWVRIQMFGRVHVVNGEVHAYLDGRIIDGTYGSDKTIVLYESQGWSNRAGAVILEWGYR